LRDKAIRDNRDYLLHVDIGGSRFRVGQEDVSGEEGVLARETGFVLPPEVKILDVWLQSQGKQATGEVVIRFNRKGYVEKSIIHLGAEDEDRMSILLFPFLTELQIIEAYVEPDSGS
jgi:general secretion pathway protein H